MLLWLAFPAGVGGQEYAAAQAEVRQLTLEDGLPHREVRSCDSDVTGLRWLATGAGLVLYDGHRFTRMDTRGLPFTHRMARGAGGLLYHFIPEVPDSVQVYDPQRHLAYSLHLGSWPLSPGRRFYHRSGEAFYYLTESTVNNFRQVAASPRPGSAIVHHLRPLPGRFAPADTAAALAPPELISAGPEAYTLYHPGQRIVERHRRGATGYLTLPPGCEPLHLAAAQNETLWLLTQNGVYTATAESDAFAPLPGALLPRRPYNQFFEDARGNIILGFRHPYLWRYRELYLLADGQAHDIGWLAEMEDRLLDIRGSDFTRSILLTSYGGLLTVDFVGGQREKFERFLYDETVKTGAFGHVMRGITTDAEGNAYANKDSRTNAWFRLGAGATAVDTLPILDETGREVEQWGCGTNMLYHQGRIYGHSCYRSDEYTLGHLYVFDPDTELWDIHYMPEKGQVIRYLLLETDGRGILAFTESVDPERSGQVWRFEPEAETFTQLPFGPGASAIKGYPRKVAYDKERSTYWIGSTKGLYRLSEATRSPVHFPLPDGMAVCVLDLLVEDAGTLLVGTAGEGLLRFDPRSGGFRKVGGLQEPGGRRAAKDFISLPSDDIAGLTQSPGDILLITTFNGLVARHKGVDHLYTVRDGLPSNEFNTTSLHYDPVTGRQYAGGINGFVRFRPADLIPKTSPYQPLIVAYREVDESDGEERLARFQRPATNELTIPPGIAYFALDFALPDYEGGEPVRYETKLEGFDPTWRTPEPTPNIRYTRLPAGAYTFRLRAVDRSGRRTAEMEPLAIRVLKPWYRQTWFLVLAALLALCVAAGFAWLRFTQVRERLRASEQVKDLELRTLRQQMNPHFISNAMNAIREYLLRESPEAAAGYLTDFSRLMRYFLEASRKPATTIADEVQLLELYIRLERLRFPGKFDYTISVAPELDPDMDEVPSFLLQPLVENAINHGLFPLESGGELHVRFTLDGSGPEEAIVCTVSDNGVGRAAAATARSRSGHKSRSTEILRDRQRFLAGDQSLQFRLETADLRPGHAHPGTVATITLSASLAA